MRRMLVAVTVAVVTAPTSAHAGTYAYRTAYCSQAPWVWDNLTQTTEYYAGGSTATLTEVHVSWAPYLTSSQSGSIAVALIGQNGATRWSTSTSSKTFHEWYPSKTTYQGDVLRTTWKVTGTTFNCTSYVNMAL